MKVLIVARPDRAAAVSAASAAAGRLRSAGHDVVEIALDTALRSEEVDGATLACVFGGDGTILRAARALAPHGVPLLGVNLGRLGFLTATSLERFDDTLAEIGAGRFETETRTLLDARLERGGTQLSHVNAMNDVVVARGALVRSIHVEVRIDDEPFTVYWADGLIVATATGSTAYGFSVGGPIILPGSDALVIVPIAPHLSFRNAVVLDEDQRIELIVRDEPARLSLDGQEELDLHVGDIVRVRRSETVVRLVRTDSMQPFLALLKQKILKEDGSRTS